MVDRCHEVALRQERALAIGDGHQWRFAEPGVERLQVRNIQATVKRRDVRSIQCREQREMN